MSDTHRNEARARKGILYLVLAAGAIPIVVSAFDHTHWTTFSRWYAIPTAAVVAGRFFLGWFRSLVWRVAGAGALYLAVAALCSAVIAWWNWMVFAAVAALGVLLVVLLGRYALRLLVTLGLDVTARVSRAWSRWQTERKLGATEGAIESGPLAGGSLDSSEPDAPDEASEPDPGDEDSEDSRSDTTDEDGHAPRSRLGRLAEP